MAALYHELGDLWEQEAGARDEVEETDEGGGEGEEEVVGGWTVRARRVEGRMGRKGGARTLGAALREASEEL
jgi:hypothetical protein